MPSKKCRLPKEFGVFSKLSPQKITEIRAAAYALVASYYAGDKKAWETIIKRANDTLSKYERGFFSGLVTMEYKKNEVQNG